MYWSYFSVYIFDVGVLLVVKPFLLKYCAFIESFLSSWTLGLIANKTQIGTTSK